MEKYIVDLNNRYYSDIKRIKEIYDNEDGVKLFHYHKWNFENELIVKPNNKTKEQIIATKMLDKIECEIYKKNTGRLNENRLKYFLDNSGINILNGLIKFNNPSSHIDCYNDNCIVELKSRKENNNSILVEMKKLFPLFDTPRQNKFLISSYDYDGIYLVDVLDVIYSFINDEGNEVSFVENGILKPRYMITPRFNGSNEMIETYYLKVLKKNSYKIADIDFNGKIISDNEVIRTLNEKYLIM